MEGRAPTEFNQQTSNGRPIAETAVDLKWRSNAGGKWVRRIARGRADSNANRSDNTAAVVPRVGEARIKAPFGAEGRD